MCLKVSAQLSNKILSKILPISLDFSSKSKASKQEGEILTVKMADRNQNNLTAFSRDPCI